MSRKKNIGKKVNKIVKCIIKEHRKIKIENEAKIRTYNQNALSPPYPLLIFYVSRIYHVMFACIVYICHMYASMLILIGV